MHLATAVALLATLVVTTYRLLVVPASNFELRMPGRDREPRLAPAGMREHVEAP
jgi:hypothetical protein